jgi:hypothetical protein
MYNLQINNNGDDLCTITANLAEAKRTILAAESALSKCRPHGRNYQTVKNGVEVRLKDTEIHNEFMIQLATMVRHLEDTQLQLLR